MGFRWETVVQDVRFALRQMRRSPGFAVTAVLMLALGMGASTAIFGFVDAALIQPLPYAQPNRLVDVAENAVAFPRSNLSRLDYEDWKRMNTTLASLDVYTGTGFLLRMGDEADPVPAGRVSAGFFHTLGVQPIAGAGFSSRGGSAGRGEDRDAAVRDVEGAVRRAEGCDWTAGEPERGRVHDCGRAAAELCVCAAGDGGVLGAVTGQDAVRDAAELPRPVRGGAAEGWRDGGAGAGRFEGHCCAAGPAVSGFEPGPGSERAAADGADCGEGSADPADAAGRGRAAAADCVRERGEPAAGAGGEAAAGDRGAGGAGGHAGAAGAAVCDRRAAAGGGGVRGRAWWWPAD